MKDSVAYTRVTDAPGLVLSTAHYTEFEFKPHYHLDYHLGVIVDGVQRQKINGKSALFGPGCISVVPPDQLHDGSTYSGDHYTLRTFRVSTELLDGYLEDIFQVSEVPGFHGALIEDPKIAQLLLNMHSLLNQGNPLQQIALEQQWIDAIEPLFLKLGAKAQPDIESGLGTHNWQRVREYCHAHLDSKIVLETLAELCQMSRFQFLRRFEVTTGLTPRAWLIRLRLERACELLKPQNQSIAEVANRVGFYDQSHFNRAFRQAFGVAPSDY